MDRAEISATAPAGCGQRSTGESGLPSRHRGPRRDATAVDPVPRTVDAERTLGFPVEDARRGDLPGPPSSRSGEHSRRRSASTSSSERGPVYIREGYRASLAQSHRRCDRAMSVANKEGERSTGKHRGATNARGPIRAPRDFQEIGDGPNAGQVRGELKHSLQASLHSEVSLCFPTPTAGASPELELRRASRILENVPKGDWS